MTLGDFGECVVSRNSTDLPPTHPEILDGAYEERCSKDHAKVRMELGEGAGGPWTFEGFVDEKLPKVNQR